MPRFYFDIFSGSDVHRDVDGREMANPFVAEMVAKRAAGEIVQGRLLQLPDAAPENIQIEVKDEHRQAIFAVTVSIQIDRLVNTDRAVS